MRHSFTRLALSLAVGVALISSAMSVHAAGLTTDQVSAIISMLKSFGVEQTTITQVNQVLGGSSASSGSSSASSISCVDITRTLTIDSQGSDVTSLQAYLIAKGYLASGNATGFYGTQTAQAVGKLQVALGIISASDSGLGILGPKTRAAIACTPQTITETPAPTQTQIQTLTTPTQTALTTTIPFPVINSFTMTPVSTTGGSTSSPKIKTRGNLGLNLFSITVLDFILFSNAMI
jgi:peptidoglycan hydrolase-like protein with peptidoglycan-binding domain